MNMKKVFMILIAFALVFTMAGAVSADDEQMTNYGTSQGTLVDYTNTATAEILVTIPAEIYLVEDYTPVYVSDNFGDYPNIGYLAEVVVKKMVLSSASKYLTIAVDSQNDFYLTSGNGKVGYEIHWQGLMYSSIISPDTSDSVVIQELYAVEKQGYPQTLPVSAELEFWVTENIFAAGSYQDTLTFTVSELDYTEQEEEFIVCSFSNCALEEDHIGYCLDDEGNHAEDCVFYNADPSSDHEGSCAMSESEDQCTLSEYCVLGEEHSGICRDNGGYEISENIELTGCVEGCAFSEGHIGECVVVTGDACGHNGAVEEGGEIAVCVLESEHDGDHRDSYGNVIAYPSD